MLLTRTAPCLFLFLFAHVGTEGNEDADAGAKAATRLPPCPQLPLSWRDAVRIRCAPLASGPDEPNPLRASLRPGPYPIPPQLWPSAARRLGQLRTGASPWLGGSRHEDVSCPGCSALFSRSPAIAHPFSCAALAPLRARWSGKVDSPAALWLAPEAAMAFLTEVLALRPTARRQRSESQ